MAHTVKKTAFTLIELLLVMTIMTVLGIFAALAIMNAHDHAKVAQTRATMQLMGLALDKYREDIGHYPRCTGSSLEALLTEPSSGWKGASTEWMENREDFKDAWGMVIEYCSHVDYDTGSDTDRGVERTPKMKDFYNSKTYQMYSTGPNMKTWLAEPPTGYPRLCGTEPDDIRNWTHERFYGLADYE